MGSRFLSYLEDSAYLLLSFHRQVESLSRVITLLAPSWTGLWKQTAYLQKQRVTPAFIYADCCGHRLTWRHLQSKGHSPSMAKKGGIVIANQIPTTAIPRRFTTAMRERGRYNSAFPEAGERAKRPPNIHASSSLWLCSFREQAGEPWWIGKLVDTIPISQWIRATRDGEKNDGPLQKSRQRRRKLEITSKSL